MIDDQQQPDVNDRPEPATPKQINQQAQQNQASAAPRPDQRPAPGRKPLFRR